VSGADLLYLSAADVAAVDLDSAVARESIVAAFSAHHANRTVNKPKLSLSLGPGHAFQSMCAAWKDEGLAANKWLGMGNVPPGSGLPGIHALIMLNDYETRQLRAILDGNLLTALRTAAMSAAAAQFLARKASRSIGFIGCGLQARFHLAPLKSVLQGLAEIRAFSRTRHSAEGLIDGAMQQCFAGTVCDDAHSVNRPSRELGKAREAVRAGVPMDPTAGWLRPAGGAPHRTVAAGGGGCAGRRDCVR
jgi:ornithine cyclodeaminase/alanine dehydrogenase-like protein (mu-crystallin family)